MIDAVLGALSKDNKRFRSVYLVIGDVLVQALPPSDLRLAGSLLCEDLATVLHLQST